MTAAGTCPHCGARVAIEAVGRGRPISPPRLKDHLMVCPVLFDVRQAQRRADFDRFGRR